MIDPFRCNSCYHFLKCVEFLKFIGSFLNPRMCLISCAFSRQDPQNRGRSMAAFTYLLGYLAIESRAAKVARPE